MARGLLAGAATGLVISVAGAAGLSLFMGYPPTPDGVLPEPAVSDSAVPEGAAPEAAGDAGIAPAGETTPGPAGNVTSLETPAPDAALPEGTDTDPAAVPDVAGESAALQAPDEMTGETGMDRQADPAGTETSGPASAPMLEQPDPTTEAGVAVVTDPAQPPMPEMPQDDIALAAPMPEAEDAVPLMPRSDDPAPETTPSPSGMDAPDGVQDPAPEAASDPAPAPSISLEDAPEVSAEAPEDEGADTEDTPPEAQDEIAALTPPAEENDADRPGIGQPARSLTDREDSARSTRLPTIGDAPEAGAENDSDTAAASGANAGAGAGPFQRYAAPVDIAADTPRMAVILIDDGSGPLGPNALDAFPFPVTFAVDPAASDAAQRMAGYREKGFEVLALIDLPEGARPSDLEVTFESAFGTLTEALGALEAPGAGMQASRELSEQVASYLGASGHGLVMQGKGLNTATSLARREGVPAGAVFRDIDGDGQDPGVQRRLLDRMALRARQDGQVIALGRLKADTLSALLLWGLQDRAGALELVPVSAVIGQE
ncbi:Divergent polysaccharide deacetylase [Roseivivax sp. THAF40]|uniref:divergent polysaccharide deacteylase family protein n=1 Tax=unclassified Roseivivax TaxID=2639302 RepID=UPI0012A786BB|nr:MULTISPECIES: divergent polysaccharide deacteylase family protein [unclassified Roseivivax]QFS83370.1 Divergent polysaccharide deacetylase [Roseivivax sp. THAF197b]QFT47114.1 Divergent polysaccharide deacetylase [Roseivivax sp. THAF40]